MNPLQRSHDFHADIGDMHAIDEEKDQKHALLSNLFIHPTARGKGLGTALKRTMTEYARDTLGYDYVWAPAEEGGASLAINLKKLGYTPLSLEKHPPGFDEDEIQYMLDEYNIGNHVMCWLKTSELPNPDA